MDIDIDWINLLGWFLAFGFATSLFYKRGVRAGIKHALTTLHLDHHQTELLNKELKKDSHDITMEVMKVMKEEIKNSNKNLLN